jgi:AAA ATPase domain
VSIVDEYTGLTPIGYRGTGVRRIIGLMGELLALKSTDQFTYILIDEPENSLHADAQHALRHVLEQLAKSGLIQVVYATHSPSMINTMRPGSIRVLSRSRDGDQAASVVENKAFGTNYYRVRSSLGLNPSDSLLYAPVTVIVEGATEVMCIPDVLMRLKAAEQAGFDDLEDLLSHTHFLDGEGDSYEYMCRLASSQNATPVLFLDGDKTESVAATRSKHPNVKVIQLQKDSEFEQIVPKERYIEAVASVLGDNTGTITLHEFEKWSVAQRKKLGFSKLVERWLQDEHDAKPLYKPIVMKKAIELTDVGDLVQRDAFRDLVAAIRDSLPF